MKNVLESRLFGIDRDSTLIEKALLNQAVNQTNRVLLLRILAKVEKIDIEKLAKESVEMDVDNLNKQVDEMQKFVIG